MPIYRFKDHDIQHEYKSSRGFDWSVAVWVAVSIFGLFLPVIVIVGMLFDLW